MTTSTPTTRVATAPARGAARTTFSVAVAGIATQVIATVVPPEYMPNLTFIVTAVIAGGLAYAGKQLRNRGIELGQLLG